MPPAAGLPAYLQRIGYEGPVMPTVETLRAMHRAHFLHVPFENLDIQRGVSIVVDLDNNYDKNRDSRARRILSGGDEPLRMGPAGNRVQSGDPRGAACCCRPANWASH